MTCRHGGDCCPTEFPRLVKKVVLFYKHIHIQHTCMRVECMCVRMRMYICMYLCMWQCLCLCLCLCLYRRVRVGLRVPHQHGASSQEMRCVCGSAWGGSDVVPRPQWAHGMKHTKNNNIHSASLSHTHARTHTHTLERRGIRKSDTWMCQVTHRNMSCHIYEWVMTHIWMSHATHMNGTYTDCNPGHLPNYASIPGNADDLMKVLDARLDCTCAFNHYF